jgi:cytochrome c oxidase subunit 3
MKKRNNQKHPFHLVDPSPWPLLGALSALSITFGMVMYMHGYIKGSFILNMGFIFLLLISFFWWRDIVREGTFEGQHTNAVQKGLKLGVILFIVSEIMFFFAFFWAFFHFSFNPSIFLGGVWPPAFLAILNPWKIPLLNTILLISSGATITLAHHSIILGSKSLAINGLIATIFLAAVFTVLQSMEYYSAPFSISTSVYGSSFFMLTGFHGFHVIIGTTFLIVCLVRLILNHFTKEQHVGFEAAAWYWHFVDVVWLLLFVTVYLWGS